MLRPRLLPILACILLFSSVPAQAAWAVALTAGGNPIVVGGLQSGKVAKERALQSCFKEFGKRCSIVATGNNDCAAMANAGEGKWGVGSGRTKKAAGKVALQQCTSQHGDQCKVVHAFCGP